MFLMKKAALKRPRSSTEAGYRRRLIALIPYNISRESIHEAPFGCQMLFSFAIFVFKAKHYRDTYSRAAVGIS